MVEQSHARLPRKPRRRLEERRGVSNVSDPERNFRPTMQENLWDQVARNLAESITEKLGKKKAKKRTSFEMESGYTSDEEDEKLTLRSSKDYKDWEDDGEAVISAKMRMLFTRQPNSDPEDWWSKSFSAPVSPVRSDTLVYDHLLMNRVNKETISAAHDGRSNPEIKAWSQDNSGYGRQMAKIYKMVGAKDGVSLKSGAELKELATIWIIVDSLWNQVMIFFMCRGHDFGPLVVLWCLHQTRFFNGPTRGNVGQQRLLVESFVNSMTNENNARQRRGKAPMGADEAMKEARRLCTTSGLDPALLSKGDVYGESSLGGGRQGHRGGNNQPNNQDRSNQQRGQGQRMKTTKDKVNSCCRQYNEGKECQYGARCNRKHQCSWVDRDTGRVCWETHPKSNHQAARAANNQQPAAQGPPAEG